MAIRRGIRGLSISRPWPWAFQLPKNPKRVENREWAPPDWMIGQYVALHAAQSWDQAGAEWLETYIGEIPPKDEHPHGIIFAVAKLYGAAETELEVPAGQEVWFFGSYGWMFKEFVGLHMPIECSGAPGLWKLEGTRSVLDRVRQVWMESVEMMKADVIV